LGKSIETKNSKAHTPPGITATSNVAASSTSRIDDSLNTPRVVTAGASGSQCRAFFPSISGPENLDFDSVPQITGRKCHKLLIFL